MSRTDFLKNICSVNANIANITPDDTAVDGKPWTSKHIVDMLCPLLEVTGNPVQCYPVPGYPLGITASWEPVQEGSGDPSPDNIRPIKGRDSVTVWRFGRNLLNYEAFKKTPITRGTAVFENNGVTLTASENDCYTERTIKDGFPKECKIPVVNGEIITVSWATESNKNGKVFIFPNGDTPGMVSIDNVNGKSISYTVEAGVSFVTFRFGVANAGDTISYKNIQCTIGSEAPTEYHPYIGDNVTLTLPETIYGGSVDAVTGEGKKISNKIELDGTENWIKTTYTADTEDTFGFAARYVSKGNLGNGKVCICSHFPYNWGITSGYTNVGVLLHNNGMVYVRVKVAGVNSIDTWKAYLAAQYAAGTPVQIAYTLRISTTFQSLGASSLLALSDINTILTDADSVMVTARKDPVHLFDSLSS